MPSYKMLDLFSGLGGASRAMAEDPEWEVTTVDVEEEFDPDVCADVLELGPGDFDGGYDLIWASPPCNAFSIVSLHHHWGDKGYPIPDTEVAVKNINLVFHSLWLINKLNPNYWFLENPMALLRKVIGKPTGRITYCQYGFDYMKPTDLWGKHPDSFVYKKCKNGDPCHINSGRNEHEGLKDQGGSAERGCVPYGLSNAVKGSVENPESKSKLEAFL